MSIRNYIILAVFIGVIVQLPTLQPLFVWDRQAIMNGEIWRILTGNITHTNWVHLGMNSAAFLIISYIFRHHYHSVSYTLLIFVLSLTIGVGLFSSSITWYAGFSGVLHGIFAWGAMKDIQTNTKGGWLLLIALIIKISWECYAGGSTSSEAMIGARVAIEAHAIGGISGLIYGIIVQFNTSNKKRDL